MALPTSVSSTSWIQELDTGPHDMCSLPLNSLKTSHGGQVSENDLSTLHKTVPPSDDALEFLNMMAGSTEIVKKTPPTGKNFSPSRTRISASPDANRKTPSPVGAILHGEADQSFPATSSDCTLTSAHQGTAISAVISMTSTAAGDSNALKVCSSDIASITQSLLYGENAAEIKVALNDFTSRSDDMNKDNLGSRSTPTETTFDCENGTCEGKEMKCRRCGKTVPKVLKMAGKAAGETLTPGTLNVAHSVNKQCDKSKKSKENERDISSSNAVAHQSKKCARPRYYSALLGACSRSVKKKGSRRSSVDVLYAREPTEPNIEKIKSKRRLSRQTDVSSFELMTLAEGNENDDILLQDSSKVTQKPREPKIIKRIFENQNPTKATSIPKSPNFGKCPQFTASSSTDSCPPAPWNSLETNYSSSQDMEDRYNNYPEHFSDDHRRDSGRSVNTTSLQQSVLEEEEPEALEEKLNDMENECEDDGEIVLEPSDDEPLNLDNLEDVVHNMVTRGAKKKKKKKKSSETLGSKGSRKKNDQEILEGTWEPESIIIIALLVYLACKVIRFLVLLLPFRRKRRSK